MNQKEYYAKVLERTEGGESKSNYGAVIAGFADRGIDTSDIRPRENVLTYNAWRAKGRQVRKNESGVKITTYIPAFTKDPNGKEKKFMMPKTTSVFHISQTDPK